jgi:Flp pilus assembly pilin Flp
VSKSRSGHSRRDLLPELWQLLTGVELADFLDNVCWREEGQDVAEYAVMVAVILVIAIGTIRLIGSHAGNVFANVGSSIQ